MPVCPKCQDRNPQLGAVCPRDGAHYIYEDALSQAEFDPRIGTLAAEKYVIVGRISKGGMGAVYRALQLPVEREVAFKVLRTELEDSGQVQDRFAREARAVSKLQHANIITLYDFGLEKSGQPWMAMEYAPGQSLFDWNQREEVTTGRVLHVMRQLLSALSEAHRQGIVHRDLKPENIIITKSASDPDVVKLLDFGIARLVNESNTRGLTREGEVFGTPHYMAPEQARGDKNMGPPVDVYASGIMLYELLTGLCPFDADTPLAVLMMHVNEPLPTLTPRAGIEVAPELEAIVRRACAKKAAERYADAAEMLGALDEVIAMLAGAAYSQTGSHMPLRPEQRSGMFSQASAAARSQELRTTPSAPAFGATVQDPEEEVVGAAQTGAGGKAAMFAALAVVLLLVVGGVGYKVMGAKDADASVSAGQQPGAQVNVAKVEVTEPPADKPAEDPVKPVEEPTKPVEEPVKPIEGSPVDEPVKPVEEPAKPVEEPVKPIEKKPDAVKRPKSDGVKRPVEDKKPAEDKPEDKKPEEKKPARLDKEPVRLDKEPVRLDKQPVRLDQR